MKVNNIAVWTVLVLVVFFALPVYAAPVTVTLTTVADSDIRQSGPAYADGDRTEHYICNTPGDSAKIYFRYELPANVGTVTSATFKATRTAQVGSWNFNYHLYGLNNNAAGQEWVEVHSLTWNNAPANDTASPSLFTADATGILGSFLTIGGNNGGTGGGTYMISTSALIDFLNTDTDGVVNLMLARDIDDVSAQFDYFASKENGSYGQPQLELTYEPLPAVNVTTVTLATVADSDIRQSGPTSAAGSRTEHYVCNTSGNSAKIYMRFNLPKDFETATSAAFKITRTAQVGSWNFNYHLYGLNNNAAGQEWVEVHSLTWNNAPANDTASPSLFTADATGILGSFLTIGSSNGGTGGGTYTVATSGLVDFLNTDTDGVVNLMLVRDIDDVSTQFDYFASKENGSYSPPQIELTYHVNPSSAVLNAVADSDIRSNAADYALGDRPLHDVYYDWADNISKLYVKFSLPADFSTASSAVFMIDCNQVVGNNWYVPYDVYGLNDDAPYNNWADLNAGTYTGDPTGGITWDNAPGNTSGLSFDVTKTTYLGVMTDPATAPSQASFSAINLLNWLNNDTDKMVTLMLVRRVELGFEQFSGYSRWVSREGLGTPPQLELFYNRPCPHLAADLNGDCYVDFEDLAILAEDWLK